MVFERIWITNGSHCIPLRGTARDGQDLTLPNAAPPTDGWYRSWFEEEFLFNDDLTVTYPTQKGTCLDEIVTALTFIATVLTFVLVCRLH